MPIRGAAYTFEIALCPRGSSDIFQASPTLAAGDVKVSKDGGAFTNITTLPTVSPAGGKKVRVSLSVAEMTADQVAVLFSDAAGAEWKDVLVYVDTVPGPAVNSLGGVIATESNVDDTKAFASSAAGSASSAASNTTSLPSMIEESGGHKRFKATALEEAPAGEGGGGGAGTGARTVIVTVSDDDGPLEGAVVRFTQGAEDVLDVTDAAGVAEVHVDDFTWSYVVTKAGYVPSAGTVVVNASTSFPVSLELAVITPSEPDETTGFLTVSTIDGSPASGVKVQLQVLHFSSGTTGVGIAHPKVTSATDSNGLVQFPGLPRLAAYQVRIGNTGKWIEGVTADAPTTPLVGVLGIP